jgi:DNA-binding transcriptional LysR family regulator
MLDRLEALLALAEAGTMTRAAARLRVSQSAVSKRISALQVELRAELIEREGRRVRITPAGQRLVERARPLLAELRGVLTGERADRGGVIVIGVSESTLTSWAAAALARAARRVTGLDLRINAHRSPVTVERVRAGEYMLALCAGQLAPSPDLITELAIDEPMVVVPSGLRRIRLRRGDTIPIMTIEPGSATWRALEPALRRLSREAGLRLEVTRSVQSFACIVQMARAGLGHGLVPRPLAVALGVPRARLVELPAPGLQRPVSLLGRPMTLARPIVAAFCASLADELRRSPLRPSTAPRRSA